MFLLRSQFLFAAATILFNAAIIPTGSAIAQTAASDAISAEQKKVFEGIVREYILENPEIISKAIQRLQEKQRITSAQAD